MPREMLRLVKAMLYDSPEPVNKGPNGNYTLITKAGKYVVVDKEKKQVLRITVGIL